MTKGLEMEDFLGVAGVAVVPWREQAGLADGHPLWLDWLLLREGR